MVHLPRGSSASGSFLYFPSFYRTKEKFDERETLMELVDKNLNSWEEVWEPFTKKFPDVALRKIPELFVPMKKMNFGRLSRELCKMTEENSIWKNNSGVIISGSTITGIFIVVTVVLSAQWTLKKVMYKKNTQPTAEEYGRWRGEGSNRSKTSLRSDEFR